MTTLQGAALAWPAAPSRPAAPGLPERAVRPATQEGGVERVPGGTASRTAWARWSWWCCGLLSLAAHAVMLNALDTAHPSAKRPGAAGAGAPAGRHAMHVRMVAAPKGRQDAAMPAAGAESAVPGPIAPAPAPAPALDLAEPVPATAARQASGMPLGQQVEASAEGHGMLPPSPGRDTYFPRSELTVPPAPRQPVILATPDDGSAAARRVGVLTLFIDEAGRVHHIAAEEPRLPSRYEEAARAAFMAATFRPGEREGDIVKSRIRIEVVFDNTPLDAP